MASRTMVSPVISRAFAELLLEAIAPGSAESHLIVSPKVALIGTSGLVLTPSTTKAELDAVESAFTGYTTGGSAITLTTPGIVRGSVRLSILAGNVVWVLGTADPLVTGQVYGYYLYDTTYGLICSENFSEPVVLGQTGDYLDLFTGVPELLQSL